MLFGRSCFKKIEGDNHGVHFSGSKLSQVHHLSLAARCRCMCSVNCRQKWMNRVLVTVFDQWKYLACSH